MKKLISLLAVLALVLGLAACNQDQKKEDWEYIKDKGEIIIGITHFAPMNYLDDNGDLTGFETEFAKAVCEILGMKPNFQVIDWKTKEVELNAKNIDCIWNGMTISPERKETMSISTPYMENKQILVVKSENVETFAASVDGLNLVAEAESAGEETIQGEAFFANAHYTAVDTQAKAVLEVASGTADACVIDLIAANGMIGEGTDFVNLVSIVERSFGAEEYGIALRKNDTEFTKKINDAIAQLAENGKLAEIAEKYNIADRLLVG